MKRNLIILIIVLLALAGGYLFLSKENISFSKETSIYKAVPLDAPLFIEVKSLKDIPGDNNILKDLGKVGIFKSLLSRINYLDTTISGSKDIVNNLRNETILSVLTLEGKENIVPLFILKVDTKSKKSGVVNLFAKVFPTSKFGVSKRPYNGRKIIGFSSKSSNEEFYYSLTNGLLIASPKAILLEEAIRQLDSDGILNDKNFALVNKTVTQQSKASIYINHKVFPPLFQKLINAEERKTMNEFGTEIKARYSREIESFSKYAAWSEFDFSINENEIKLNGVTKSDDSLKHYLSVFSGQDAMKYQIDKALPKKTALFINFGVSNKDRFFNNLEDFYKHSEIYYSREEILKKINSKSRTDVKALFENILEDEVAMAFANIPTDPFMKNTFFIVSTKGQSIAKEQIIKFLKSYAAKNSIDYSSLVGSYSVDRETKYPVYKFPFPSFPGTWLSGPFKSVAANYFAFWDNYIIFSSSMSGLNDLLHDLTLDASLAKDVTYQRYKQNIDNRANINFYLDINLGFHLNKAYFSNDVSKLIASKEEQLGKFRAISWQVVNRNDLYFNSFYINYLKEVKEDAKTTWQSNIGSKINSKPQLAINHNDLRNKEIVVQDEQNKLHQITKEGRSRWVVNISGKILSEIHQIDFLKNGKYQYLFNTEDKLYLIDRNGNNVSPFPISLRSKATNGVNVFDYDGNRNYRYFVAGKDKKIYVYDSAGKVVTGWKFKQTDHPVALPVQHFRAQGKDYIVFKDKSRIYIQDRRGATRVNTAAKFENSNNPLILNSTGTPKIIATDKEGSVYYLYFNGRFVKKKTPKCGKNHLFAADDLNGDGIIDFVFADNSTLKVINENGKTLFSEDLKSPIVNSPNIYTFSSKLKKIGITVRAKNRIYLFNPDGSLHQGFPLIGNSEFSIGKITAGSSYFNLIVGSDDGNIYNYKLN